MPSKRREDLKMLQKNQRPSTRLVLAVWLLSACAICVYPHLYYAKIEPPGENALLIPGAGIHANLRVASYTQEAVDNNDVVYSLDNGKNHPFILGHDYGSLRKLHKTEIGGYIYTSIAGKEEAYRVVVSEYARSTDNERDIIGQETGASIRDSLGNKTLHLYTCHGWRENGRWLVLAVLDPTITTFPQITGK